MNATLERSSRQEAEAASASAAALQQQKVALSAELQEERSRLASTLTKLTERGHELDALSQKVLTVLEIGLALWMLASPSMPYFSCWYCLWYGI